MSILASVILPVFIVLGFGYVATWRGLIGDAGIDGLMRFAQGFALPCLLFSAIAGLDLSQDFDLRLLGSFYTGAISGFLAGLFGARWIFGRPWEDSVAIGFAGLFSNSLLLGLPITERAYGAEALAGNYALLAFHAPFCYAVGITAMELIRARGESLRYLPVKVLGAMFRNSLVIGIALGFVVNLGGVPLPEVLEDAIALVVRAALPVALFGLGGILYRYRPDGDLRTVLYITAVSLVLHPGIVWLMGQFLGLDRAALRSAVMMAAMAPGVNAYLFANMYGVARRVNATAVLIGTAASLFSIAVWLHILP